MSFWRAYYHLIWATKNRSPIIDEEVESALHGYLLHTANEKDVYVYAMNGWYDHIHMIVAIPPKHAVADIVKQLKGASSFNLNKLLNWPSPFVWQIGFGVLTISEKDLDRAIMYVNNQKEHHRQQKTNPRLEAIDDVGMSPIRERGVLRVRDETAVYTQDLIDNQNYLF